MYFQSVTFLQHYVSAIVIHKRDFCHDRNTSLKQDLIHNMYHMQILSIEP